MKNLLRIFLFCGMMWIQSCDKVDHPFKTKTNTVDTSIVDTSSHTTTVFTDTTPQPRIVLLEDYTGHRCGNCPPAAAAATALKTQYGEQLVVMAVHAGSLANPLGLMSYDFRNTAATELYVQFGAPSNPNGMVNRVGFPAGTHIKAFSTWAGNVAVETAKAADANIFLKTEYEASTRNVKVNVKTKWLNALTGTFKIALYIVEDSIVKPQLDYNFTPDTIYTYVHRHALRGAINTTWGTSLPTPVATSSVEDVYSITLDPAWVPEHCEVIAYVYNTVTYEVVQASEKKVK